MSENKWTKANRSTTVLSHTVSKGTVGEGFWGRRSVIAQFGPEFEDLNVGDCFWMREIKDKTNLDNERTRIFFYLTEADARASVEARPVGSVWGKAPEKPQPLKDSVEQTGYDVFTQVRSLSTSSELTPSNRLRDAINNTCLDALRGAGVHSKETGETSEHVLDWLGQETVIWMKRTLGDDWRFVAEWEYCLNHFPASSLATLSAHLFVARYVTRDDFTDGYLTKEIEVIEGGAEAKAVASAKRLENSGPAGGKASSARRLKNVGRLLDEIDKLKPAARLMSEERIFAAAIENLSNSSESFPSDNRTLDGYISTIKTDEPFKSQYKEIFGE